MFISTWSYRDMLWHAGRSEQPNTLNEVQRPLVRKASQDGKWLIYDLITTWQGKENVATLARQSIYKEYYNHTASKRIWLQMLILRNSSAQLSTHNLKCWHKKFSTTWLTNKLINVILLLDIALVRSTLLYEMHS